MQRFETFINYIMTAHIANSINTFLRRFGYEVKATARLPKQNLLGIKGRFKIQTVLDVGANIGQFALEARTHFPEATIHSFEPVRTTFDQLAKISQGNPLWHSYQLALSSEKCVRAMHVHVDHSSSSSLLESTPTEAILFPSTIVKRDVNCVTLDEWASDMSASLTSDVLLKMDVQGHEDSVLRGARETLRHVDVIITEVIIETLYTSQARFSEIVSMLDDAQFDFVGVLEHGFSKQGNVIAFDAVFINRKQN